MSSWSADFGNLRTLCPSEVNITLETQADKFFGALWKIFVEKNVPLGVWGGQQKKTTEWAWLHPLQCLLPPHDQGHGKLHNIWFKYFIAAKIVSSRSVKIQR